MELFDRITIGEQSLLRSFREPAERVDTRAARFNDIGGVLAGNGFGHGAAAGIADAYEEHAGFLHLGHEYIVEQKSESAL